MAKNTQFTSTNVKSFVSWLKRFSIIDNSLLLELDPQKKEFVSKTHDEERSVVKHSKISFEDAGLAGKSSGDQRIMFGIYNIPHLIKALELFDGEFTLEFKHEMLSDGDKEVPTGTSIMLKNSSLKTKIDCTSLSIFNYITDQLFKDNIASVDEVTKFELTKENMEKITSLSLLDKEYKYLKFQSKDGKAYVKSKSFELLLSEVSGDDVSIDIYKNQFFKVDTESYNVQLGDDRLVCKSKDSYTTAVVSMVDRDANYEKDEMDM
jgi:hypothetical protein